MLENIVRHMEHGERPLVAALNGSLEIGFTIVSMTLSLTAVFIPVLFMLAVTVAASTFGSKPHCVRMVVEIAYVLVDVARRCGTKSASGRSRMQFGERSRVIATDMRRYPSPYYSCVW